MKKRDRGNGGVKGLREREQQAANHLESKAAGGLKKTLRNRVFATLQGKKNIIVLSYFVWAKTQVTRGRGGGLNTNRERLRRIKDDLFWHRSNMFFFGDSRLFVVGLKSDCCQPPTEQLEILFPFSLIKIKSVELAACSITFRQLTNFVEFELFFSQLSFNSPATLFIHTKLMSVFFFTTDSCFSFGS